MATSVGLNGYVNLVEKRGEEHSRTPSPTAQDDAVKVAQVAQVRITESTSSILWELSESLLSPQSDEEAFKIAEGKIKKYFG